VLDLDMEVDPHLKHLLAHDPDGFVTALEKGETLGFAACHVRSRQWVLSELWVLPQHHGKGAGDALLSRALMHGERSGAREFLAIVPSEPGIQSLLLRREFVPVCPVYVFRVPTDEAGEQLAAALSRLLPGQDVTSELLNRRGCADLDRIDKLTRNISREVDHEHWLKVQQHHAAFVRQGSRIAAYAYGGRDTTGPVAGATQEAALCALGWALEMALPLSSGSSLDMRIPARFTPAVDNLLEGGADLHSTLMLYVRGTTATFDRCAFGPTSLP
jgi:hypothetical protein